MKVATAMAEAETVHDALKATVDNNTKDKQGFITWNQNFMRLEETAAIQREQDDIEHVSKLFNDSAISKTHPKQR